MFTNTGPLETSSERVRDAVVSLAERGPGVDLFFSCQGLVRILSSEAACKKLEVS